MRDLSGFSVLASCLQAFQRELVVFHFELLSYWRIYHTIMLVAMSNEVKQDKLEVQNKECKLSAQVWSLAFFFFNTSARSFA